jgi:hypothetical protein
MPDHASQPPYQIASAANLLGSQLVVLLTSTPDYKPELGALITVLCLRLGKGEADAGGELWRLVQGLHYGGIFSTDNLKWFRRQLSLVLLRGGY